jgi:hypothetical protein
MDEKQMVHFISCQGIVNQEPNEIHLTPIRRVINKKSKPINAGERHRRLKSHKIFVNNFGR